MFEKKQFLKTVQHLDVLARAATGYPPALMVQATGSDAGKSALVTALGRIFSDAGARVFPFKPQNMALNSAVTPEGGEMGRAQALQAMACRVEAHTDMNPLLLKPTGDCSSQIIVQGRAIKTLPATEFQQFKKEAKAAVLESYGRLAGRAEVVVIEGAGSPAEINLRQGDIANMGFAEAVNAPVILIADIDRGGVFAHLVGTLALLSAEEQSRVIGFVINRFRGDLSILKPGLDWLEQYTAKPVLAVIPYLHDLYLDAEDAIASKQVLGSHGTATNDQAPLRIVVPVLPRISNHTDFDALRQHPNVDLRFAPLDQANFSADLLILPGSKQVRDDLAHLKAAGWRQAIGRHLRFGGKVLGICGGYQMLGQWIDDREGVEGTPGKSEGFGYLPVETTLLAGKVLQNVVGTLTLDGCSVPVSGYEIHCGHTRVSAQPNKTPAPLSLARVRGHVECELARPDGALDSHNQVMGCYLHGLFDSAKATERVLRWAGLECGAERGVELARSRQAQIDRWATVVLEAFLAGNGAHSPQSQNPLLRAWRGFYER